MNGFFFTAGLVATVTTVVHVIAGHVDPVRPLLGSSLAEVPKRTLHAVRHMGTATQALSAAQLLYLATGADFLTRFLAIEFIAWSAVVITIALVIDSPRPLLRLPQWTLLLPVAALAWLGTL